MFENEERESFVQVKETELSKVLRGGEEEPTVNRRKVFSLSSVSPANEI